MREVLDDPLVKRARALEELLEARSPFALVRTVELAELMASGAEGEDASATKEGAG